MQTQKYGPRLFRVPKMPDGYVNSYQNPKSGVGNTEELQESSYTLRKNNSLNCISSQPAIYLYKESSEHTEMNI